ERADRTISEEELIARAWPGTLVEVAAVRVLVAALRKALGDGRVGKRCIANLSGLGCAFISPVTREHALSATPVAPTGMARDREICRHCSRASSAATASSPGWRSSWSGAGSSHLPMGLYRRFRTSSGSAGHKA